MQCEACGSTNVVKGVYDRILQIRDYEQPRHPEGRPPYNYRVPLKDIPGLGPATIKKLNLCAENEIDLVEKTPIKRIEEVAGAGIAGIIASMRSERLKIIPGGGGKYGKVLKNNSNY
jgi:PHP family Zn ribbon phosphoesterase